MSCTALHLSDPVVRPAEIESARTALPWARRALRWCAVVVFVVTLVRVFIGEASVVPTPSMESTVLVGDHIFLYKALYGPEVPLLGARLPALRTPKRGEIIAFRYPKDPRLTFLKRVIAVGGDTIEIRHNVVYRNGLPIAEPYAVHLFPVAGINDSMPLVHVASGQLFVMGDNRDDSDDSRDWGTVPVENVIGEPLLVYWSYDAPTAKWLDGKPADRMRFYASIFENLLSKTRWDRTGRLL